MSRRDPNIRLRHMLAHASEAVTLVAGHSRADLEHDRTLQLALVRLLEIVGEAAAHVPSQVTTQYPEIPWAQIVGLRNRLIHGYDTVDLDIVWSILTDDLPPLVAQLRRLLP
jgi:uncharacterized protein with HEPN domain